jgi:hypothetical protein
MHRRSAEEDMQKLEAGESLIGGQLRRDLDIGEMEADEIGPGGQLH